MSKWDNEPQEINMDGFQVVSGEMFQHPPRICDSSCTFWYDSISFGKLAIASLNNCENIRIDINSEKHLLLVSPVTERDQDKIRWITVSKVPQPRRLTCRSFAKNVYDTWKWDKAYVYRAPGKLVIVGEQIKLLFDFSHPESWKFKTKVGANG